MLLTERNTPRWIIFLFDVAVCIGSLMLAYLLRFNFHIPKADIDRFFYSFPTLVIVRAGSFYISKIYAGIIRYTSTKDAQRVFFTVTGGTLFFFAANFIAFRFINMFINRNAIK